MKKVKTQTSSKCYCTDYYQVLLTAAHCVKDIKPEDLIVRYVKQ